MSVLAPSVPLAEQQQANFRVGLKPKESRRSQAPSRDAALSRSVVRVDPVRPTGEEHPGAVCSFGGSPLRMNRQANRNHRRRRGFVSHRCRRS